MFVSIVLSRITAWLRYRETVRELSQLSDRELADVGVARSEIASVARANALA